MHVSNYSVDCNNFNSTPAENAVAIDLYLFLLLSIQYIFHICRSIKCSNVVVTHRLHTTEGQKIEKPVSPIFKNRIINGKIKYFLLQFAHKRKGIDA